MPRLIDADVLCDRLIGAWNTAEKESEQLICGVMAKVVTPIVVGTPTVDAVEVVRCKNCKYYLPDEPTICELTMCGANDEGFCAWAERKKDAKEE